MIATGIISLRFINQVIEIAELTGIFHFNGSGHGRPDDRAVLPPFFCPRRRLTSLRAAPARNSRG
jgi:hypothetical protein